MNGKTLYLVDGSAIFYRAYFAFIRNPLINSKGEDTSATFGFVNSILKVIREENPDYLAVIFDTKAPTFRHKMSPEYKSTRAKMPEELIMQLPRIKEATEALELPAFEMEGFEADDIIGTLAKAGEKKGMDVWIVTGDKDMFQLVTDKVKIYNPQKGSTPPEKLDKKGVEDKFGVPPELVIDTLSLMGDASDNVKGVPGIGPKTARLLLKEFGSLDAILENPEKIKAKGVRTKIMENIESARLARKLVTIDISVPVEFSLKDMRRGKIDFDKAKKFFLEMEFNRLLEELAKLTGRLDLMLDLDDKEKVMGGSKADYICLEDIEALEKLIGALSSKKEVAVDTETTSLNALEADLVGVSLCAEAGKAYYIPIGHEDKKRNLPREKALKLLSKLLADRKVQKFGQNIKYDLEVLHRAGLDIDPVSFDTMLGSYVINPSGRQNGLNALALEHFNYSMQPITDLIGSGKKQISFAKVDVDKAAWYAAEDADYTYRLRGVLAPKIDELKLHNLYYNIEMPLIKVLASMEEAGVRVDPEYLADFSLELEKQLDKLTGEIYIEAGMEFNINSTQQLSHILFEKLNLPTKGKTAKKTGFSTDVRVLEELAGIHKLPRLILEYRQLGKLKSTYVDAIPALINPETGRVHTSFNQTIAATGRLSSTDPNLQNIPVRTEIGRRIRRAFLPRDENYRLLVADYSQIELRILAHFSDDKTLIQAFKNNEDIHARTAAEVYGVDMKKVTPEMRRAAKTANFAVIYGVSAYGLSMQSELDVAQSKEFIETYFSRYPGIKKYMEETKQFARDNGYVTTLFNRIRYLPEINAKNFQVRQFAERTAINTPIQGTAADMIKLAMIDIYGKISGMKSKMILQVHDELIFDAHKDEIDKLRNIVRDGMEKAVSLKVPIVADMGVGDNWLEAK
ncbi:MAG: DNA polymerase I [candidate division Zixibacteria bacterium HGW-Zixibacteria-1]|nr:MAG: DNA polymerase I [candidate division Zixibacteria bacterium HGW-Zixibacteria-1]